MAHTNGYDYDIFISYAHNDNFRRASGQGWIDQFHTELSNWLVKRRALKNLRIWQAEQDLGGNQLFDQAIKDRIQSSALFFAINSRNYLQSDYCQKELHWFCDANKHGFGTLYSGDHSRIFNILIANSPHEKWPDPLKGATGFPMHDAPDPSQLGDALLPTTNEFVLGLRRIVDSVEQTLGQFDQYREHSDETSLDSTATQVFIADVPDSLQRTRDLLVADLREQKIVVQSEVPPPMESVAHQKVVNETLNTSILSIHLLDRYPGRSVIDERSTTYPRQQIDLAMNHTVPKLVWLPPELDLDTIDDPEHAVLIQHLDSGTRDAKNYEFIRRSSLEFTQYVLRKLSERPNDSAPQSILIDTHQKDQASAYRLAGCLSEHGADVKFNQESHDPIRSLENFEYNVKRVKNLILVFGKVGTEWLTSRIRKAINVAAEQFEDMPLENVWIFMTPECGGQISLPRLPPLFKVIPLDNSHSDQPDPKVFSSILSPNGLPG